MGECTEQEMKPIAMNGGVGPDSYSQNSSYQGNGATTALAMIGEAITKGLDMRNFPVPASGEPFRIADLGCSVGPNTFGVVGGIIDAVKLKYCKSKGDVLEFQVFFNDTVSNDFNTLLRSPQWEDNRYFASAVPGSFHGRLFPKSSLHFVHSAYSVQWLSRLPKAVLDDKSPAWNTGKITFLGSKPETVEAFFGQFAVDMDSFLQARAEEVVPGGVMALVFPFQETRLPLERPLFSVLMDLLESALADMVALGKLDEGKVDSFNLPAYLPTADEFETLVKKNGSFSIEKMQPLTQTKMAFDARALSTIIRAVNQMIMNQHFGIEIMDEIFDRHRQKIEESSHLIMQSMEVSQDIFVLLKRKPN